MKTQILAIMILSAFSGSAFASTEANKDCAKLAKAAAETFLKKGDWKKIEVLGDAKVLPSMPERMTYEFTFTAENPGLGGKLSNVTIDVATNYEEVDCGAVPSVASVDSGN